MRLRYSAAWLPLSPCPGTDALRRLRAALSAYRDAEDLIQPGAYVAAANPELDKSIQLRPELTEFLRRDHLSNTLLGKSLEKLDFPSGRQEAGAAAFGEELTSGG